MNLSSRWRPRREALPSVTALYGASVRLRIRHGSVAYIDGDRLIRADSRGTRTLDEGPGIAPGSLAANRTRLYWIKDGTVHTASFV
jgi:hypothetical protein